ncbi:unnamed protein product [Clonostachys byssicola]|uniref:Uncharacterized protein n=1 Tax=Clonostachys byssicola TaxID=160290 RepID=A0A9N9UCW2_9HYPO|nr:unnamed protein product [Clonostachys byssicola]
MASQTCREQVMCAPESLVKAVLLALCEDKNVEKIALARLDALTKSSGALQGPARKRKATNDLAVCAQCDKPFYKDDNQPKDCLYHPGSYRIHLLLLSSLNPWKVCTLWIWLTRAGESEVDRGHHVWDDHDEDCHGEIDSDYMRKEHPEGYIWSCCDKNGKESAGCTRGYHESDPAKAWKEASEIDTDEEDSEEDSEDYDD